MKFKKTIAASLLGVLTLGGVYLWYENKQVEEWNMILELGTKQCASMYNDALNLNKRIFAMSSWTKGNDLVIELGISPKFGPNTETIEHTKMCVIQNKQYVRLVGRDKESRYYR